MSKRIAIIGAGAVGGYAGAHMTAAGHDVTLIDPWPEHVDQMKSHGMEIFGMTPRERMTVQVNAMHVTEVQDLAKQRPIDIAFIAVKSYDTIWATTLIGQYLSASGCVVSMQNCINEERVAGVVGWGRTLGCIVTGGVGVDLYQPGHIRRGYAKRADITSFYVGEPTAGSPSGRRRSPRFWRVSTQRKPPTTFGASAGPSCASTVCATASRPQPAWAAMRVTTTQRYVASASNSVAKSVRVGQKLGYKLGKVGALPFEILARAMEGDTASYADIERLMTDGGAGQAERSDYQRPSMAQDMEKGRRTEIEFMNGFIASEGARIGLQAPTHEMLTRQVLRVERGEILPRPENLLVNS